MRVHTLLLAGCILIGSAGVAAAQTPPPPPPIPVGAAGTVSPTRAAGASAVATPTAAPCPPNETLRIMAPMAAAPTTVSVQVSPPLNLKPAAENDPNSFHLHYFIDLNPATVIKLGQPIPLGNPQIIHTAATTQDVGQLTAGPHTVWVVLAQVNHIPCTPSVQSSVTFTVAAPAVTAVAPRSSASPVATVASLVPTPLPAIVATAPVGAVVSQAPAVVTTVTPIPTVVTQVAPAPVVATVAPVVQQTTLRLPNTGSGGVLRGERTSRAGAELALAALALIVGLAPLMLRRRRSER